MNKRCAGKLHYSFLSIVLVLSSVFLYAQSNYNTTNWRFSNPTPMGITFLDMDFFDNNSAIAVGGDGGIARTTDGGANWTYGAFTFTSSAGLTIKTSLSDVHFVTSSVAYVVGTNGCMAKSTDGGVTWSFITTPLYANAKSINAVWFVDANKGYIGGQWNTADSIPKLYFTNNGGATWDSLNAPMGGKSRVGYINNPNLPPLMWDVTAKGKEIYRIEFSSPATGYITGGGSSLFPPMPAANSSTCLPTGGTIGTSGHNAALVWKFSNGVLTDYSLSKERLGYSGINTNTITCTTQFNSAGVTPTQQQYRAINIINDSLVVLMSFNNNCVVRVHTGRNDSTNNLATGLNEAGRYQIMNFPFPPTGGPQAGGPIPNPQVLLASNPYQIRKAANGTLYANGNFGRLWTSIDTGRNWVQQNCLPANTNYNQFAVWAMDITPGGKFYVMGQAGVKADSTAGGVWTSNYKCTAPGGSYFDFDFADCNNGIAAGGASITVTTDGGKTWIDRGRPDFIALNININAVVYQNINKAYLATSVGNLYRTTDQAQTLDPIYANNLFQLNDVATAGSDSIWVAAYSSFSVPSASRTSSILRSFDNGATWQTIGGFPIGTTGPNLNRMTFPSRNVGYIAGSRNGVYKTTDAGATWTRISPFPSLNEGPTGFPNAFITYQEIVALDDNTVFLIGNMFTNTGVKRVYKTTNGGANWTDITGNLPALLPVGNLIGLAMHDANSGYITAGSTLFYTTDGGANWVMDLPPASGIFETMAFAPRTVPAGIPFANRKLFVSGLSFASTLAPIMEYGNPFNVNVNSTETIVNASCTNLAGGSITVNASGGLAPYTYSLNGGAFQSSNVFSGLTQGAKTITVKDAFCGLLTKTINITFNDNLTLTTNNDTTVCAGAPVQMQATSNGATTTYAWAGSGLSATNISNPVAITNNAAAYTVTATLNGCVRTKTVNVGIKPNPIINAGPDKTILAGELAGLQGSGALNAQSISWTPTATIVNGGNTYGPVVQPATTTTYTLTVKDANNCTSTDNAVVTVIPYCAAVMDAFTPNGDGQNDRWIVSNGTACYTQLSVSVFNRYGGEVYKNANYQNDWTGTYKGKAVADGTYYYVVTFKLINGRSATLKGDVTILR